MAINNANEESNECDVMNFKKGDKVTCIEEHYNLTKGKIYEVNGVREDCYIHHVYIKHDDGYEGFVSQFLFYISLSQLIDTANQGLDAISTLTKEHRDNPNLYYTHAGFDGKDEKFKTAFLFEQSSPAKIFLKEEPKFESWGTSLSVTEARKLLNELSDFLRKNK